MHNSTKRCGIRIGAQPSIAASDANPATADAQQRQKDAESESERNRLAAANSDQQLQQAVRDREELRARLLIQFNAILETRDTARGLVVNMSDVLFDSAKFTLRPAAREKLAKISGIVLAYPSLALSIEGNTDSVGTDCLQSDALRKSRRFGARLPRTARHSRRIHDVSRIWQDAAGRFQRHVGRTAAESPRRARRIRRSNRTRGCDRSFRNGILAA